MDAREVVVVGEPLDPRTVALRRKVQRSYPPHHGLVLVHDANREALEKLSVLVEGKTAEDGVPAAYVCRHGACEAPVTDPDALVLGRAQAAR